MPAAIAKPPSSTTSTRSVRPKPATGRNGANGVNGANGAVNGAVNGAASYASPYGIMASRLANRISEMAENMTFIEREKPAPTSAQISQIQAKRPPRKLEIRLANSAASSDKSVSFSAPFLDNTLAKMLALQGRMLKVSQELASASDEVDEEVRQEQYAQSAELSRIIALICAEKARQGA